MADGAGEVRSLPEFDNATHCEVELLQLKDHLASGEKNTWAMYTDDYTETFLDYESAYAKFYECPTELRPRLYLYTRIGTAVLFHYKEPEMSK